VQVATGVTGDDDVIDAGFAGQILVGRSITRLP
jgi:hypothetical protein